MKTNNTLLYVAAALIALLAIVSTLQGHRISTFKQKLHELQWIIDNADTTTTTKTDTITLTNTIKEKVPIYKTKTVIKTDTIISKDLDTFDISLNVKKYEATKTNDKGDTINYQAFISGYDKDNQGYPRLDSINVHTSHKVINTLQTVTIEKKVPQKASKWHLSPSIGLGYGLTTKQFDAFCGITLGYDITK